MLFYVYIHHGGTNEEITDTIFAQDEEEAYNIAWDYGKEHFGDTDLFIDVDKF